MYIGFEYLTIILVQDFTHYDPIFHYNNYANAQNISLLCLKGVTITLRYAKIKARGTPSRDPAAASIAQAKKLLQNEVFSYETPHSDVAEDG